MFVSQNVFILTTLLCGACIGLSRDRVNIGGRDAEGSGGLNHDVRDVSKEGTTVPVSQRAGFRGRITQKGFDFAADLATNMLMKELSNLKIPDVETMIGPTQVTVSDIKVTDFPRPTCDLTTIPFPGYGLRWGASDLNPTITADYAADIKIGFWTTTKTGTANFYGRDIEFVLDFFVGKDTDGRPTTEVLSCYCEGDVTLSFEGQWSDVLNLGSNLFGDQIEGLITAQICAQAKANINTQLAEQLRKIPLTHTVAEDFLIDFSMMHFPKIQEDAVDVELKGAVYLAVDPVEPPFYPPEMRLRPEDTERMVYLYVTDYLINSAFYASFRRGVLAYTVTQDMLPEEYQGYLNTSCPSELCIGTIFSQVAVLYPDAHVSVELMATSSPSMSINGKQFNVSASGEAKVYAELSDGNRSALFIITVNIFGSFNADIIDKKIILGVNDIVPSAKVKESFIGDIGTGFFFESILKVAVQKGLIPRLQELGQKGLNIPKVKSVDFVGPMVVDSDIENVFIVATDISYQPKRKRKQRKRVYRKRLANRRKNLRRVATY